MINSKGIGVFDSGVGGLTVAGQVMELLPNEQIIYFGDCLRAPYGDRSPEELTQFSREIVDFLLAQGIKALVVACGTISARVFDVVEGMVDMPVMGMVAPAARAAVDVTKTGHIGVIATSGTAASGAHKAAITHLRPDTTVAAVACPLFVPLAEEGWTDNGVTDLAAQVYMENFNFAKSGVDTMVLGCTHYPLLINSITKALPKGVAVVDPAVILARDLKEVLEKGGLLRGDNLPPEHRLFVSGNKEKFDKMSEMVLCKRLDSAVVKL